MKFVTFEVKTMVGSIERMGIIRNNQIIDLNTAYACYLQQIKDVYRWRELADAIMPPNMLKFIQGGEASFEATQLALDCLSKIDSSIDTSEGKLKYQMNEVRLKAPVPQPISIRDGMLFLQHVKSGADQRGQEIPKTWFEIPSFYRTSHTDVIGPDDPIIWPSYTEKLDFELEFALCIGKRGINIPAAKANDYIFGYTIFNDISARDIQVKEHSLGLGPAKGKCFRNSNIMGPCLVTPEEIDANNLRMTAKINGELWSDGNSKDMHFKFSQLIEYISKDDYLHPGEFIGSGTVGTGCGRELNKWIKPGDIIEFEVEGIGILRNRVTRIR